MCYNPGQFTCYRHAKAEEETITGYLCATTLTTLYYLAAKVLGKAYAKKRDTEIAAPVRGGPVNRQVLEAALVTELARILSSPSS